MNERAVVFVGNISDGYTIVGPFDSVEEAGQWDIDHNHGWGWLARIVSPEEAIGHMGPYGGYQP